MRKFFSVCILLIALCVSFSVSKASAQVPCKPGVGNCPVPECEGGLDCPIAPGTSGSILCSVTGSHIYCCPKGTYQSSDKKCIPVPAGKTPANPAPSETQPDGSTTTPGGNSAPVGGSAPAPTPQPRACGEACKTTADCRNPSTGGFPVECRNGTCQLPLTGQYACAEGKSTGSICSCSTKQQCGQQCGPAVGNKLCNPGTVCGFLTPSSACMVNGAQQTGKQYCLPVNPNQGYSLQRCDTVPASNYIAADSLKKPDGTQTALVVSDVAKACTAVCGDKVTGVGEECDWGTDNGKPGSMCDATCKTRSKCSDACTSQSMCNRHLVTLRCDITVAGRRYCGLDAIIEGTTTIEQTDPRLIKPGVWRTSTSPLFSGGTEVYNHVTGATISFWTTAREVTILQSKAANRAVFTVLIDGKVQPTKIDQYNATTLYKQATVLNMRGTDSPEYLCTTSNICRLATDTSDVKCGVVAPTPPPTDIPVPTPQTLACALTSTYTTTGNAAALQYGDMVTFTLPAISKSTYPTFLPELDTVRYEGEIVAYRGNVMVKKETLTLAKATGSQFQPYKITAGNATYYTRFRYCITNPKTGEKCSAWGAWSAPNNGSGTPVVQTSPTHTPPPTSAACATPPVCPLGSNLIYGDPRDGGCPQYQCSPAQPPSTASGKLVKFVNKTSPGRISMVVDYIKEGSTFLQEGSPRITYTGTWRVGTDSGPSGGAYRATSTNGDSFSLTTTQPSLLYRAFKYSQRSVVEVFVDGVLKNTITGLNIGSGWVDIPVAL